MKELSKLIKKIICIDNKFKIELIRAFIYTGFYRFILIFLSFDNIRGKIGEYKKESPEIIDRKTYEQAIYIGNIVRIVSSKTPWQSKCLVKALTAKKLLKNKGISTTLYLGVKKEGNEIKAHAWLRCGDYYVTGGNIINYFTVVAKFAD